MIYAKKYCLPVLMALAGMSSVCAFANPVAKDDIVFTQAGAAVTSSVSANDTDTSGTLNTSIFKLITPPLNGTLGAAEPISPSGIFTYLPNAGFSGVDVFSYQIENANGNTSGIATVFVSVGTVQFVAVANPALAIAMPSTVNRTTAVLNARANTAAQNFTATKNTQGSFNILTGLSASKALETWSPNAAGTIVSVYTLNNQPWQRFGFESFGDSSILINSVYTNFVYKAATSSAGTAISAGPTSGDIGERWMLAAPGRAVSPLTRNDNFAIANDALLQENVLVNDTSLERDIGAYIGSLPAHGQLVGTGAIYGGIVHSGGFSYQPDPGFVGTDTFTYYAKSDSTGSPSRITTVTINVTEPAPDYIVSNSTQLQAALAQATGGEIIQLQDGNYGNLAITRLYTDYVTLRAANPLGAVFSAIEITGNRGFVHFDRISAHSISATNGARNLKYTRSKFTSTVYFKVASNVIIDKNIIDVTGLHAVLVNSVANFQITRNFIARAQEDLMRVTGNAYTGLIENNIFYDTRPQNIPTTANPCEYNHSDALQMFGVEDKNPRNITIRGNLFYDDPQNNQIRPEICTPGRTGVHLNMQGIFLSDPKGNAYENLLVENNMLHLGSANSIYINGATGAVVIRNNTLLPWFSGGGGSIRVVEKANRGNSGLSLYGNIASAVGVDTTALSNGMSIGDNFVYRDTSTPPSVLFQGGGQGSIWQHYLPVENSPVDFGSVYGAQERLEQLLTGNLQDLLPPQLQ
jgi:hypothetical protein